MVDMKENELRIFQNSKIRVEWDSNFEEWFFSIVDVISVLTEDTNELVF